MPFRDREQAGRLLGRALEHLRADRPVVVGLPRGGVPVAAEVAAALDAPLDVVLVRKLGVPWQRELAMGAVGEGGVRVLDDRLVRTLGVTARDVEAVERREQGELARRAVQLRGLAHRVPLAGRTVVVVDDGVATGSTALAACRVVREAGAAQVVLAVPVAAPETVPALQRVADEVVCLQAPPGFAAVGQWYDHFPSTTDDEVVRLLTAARGQERARPSDLREALVHVPAGALRLAGDLVVPAAATGLVVFAHGSGSSRLSPRNRAVAGVLQEAGLGTLLLDLLTPEEEAERTPALDVPLLGDRLLAAVRWLRGRPGTEGLRVGCFGASTGAAAALRAAAEPGEDVSAVVSRGGRPDLAADRLPLVRCPVLLVVGERDREVLALNRQAASRLRCPHELVVVPGAGHLFEEPGALRTVAGLARGFLVRHLA